MKIKAPKMTTTERRTSLADLHHVTVLLCEADGKVLKTLHVIPPKMTHADSLHLDVDVVP